MGIGTVRVHDPQLGLHIRQMFVGFQIVLPIRKKSDFFSVGRHVAKPVAPLSEGHLRLFAAVPVHPPELHKPRAGISRADSWGRFPSPAGDPAALTAGGFYGKVASGAV